MCVALEEMKMDSRIEGEISGFVETYKEFHCSPQDTGSMYSRKI